MPSKSRLKSVLVLERKHQKELAAVVLATFGAAALAASSSVPFAGATLGAALAGAISGQLDRLHADARRLARVHAYRHGAELGPDVESDRTKRLRELAITAAAMSLAAQLARAVAVRSVTGSGVYGSLPSADKTSAAARATLREEAWRIERTATTETFTAYNQTYRSVLASQDGFFQWEAILDKRTCQECADRDGKRYRENELPDLPAHPRCRCLVTFSPT